VQVALLREANKSMLTELHQLAMDQPSAAILEALEAAGISLPTGVGLLGRSGSRSRTSSCTSSEQGSRPGTAMSFGPRVSHV